MVGTDLTTTDRDEAAARLRAAARALTHRVGHWTEARWSLREGSGPTRGDDMFALVQQVADLGAVAEGRPARPVPRLGNDMALCDQFQVMVNDLLAAEAPADLLRAATTAITSYDPAAPPG